MRKSLLLPLLFLALAAALYGQAATTSLVGSVTDTTGALIPNALVVLSNPSVGTTVSVHSNSQGQYEFQSLTPGTYTLTVSASGFSTYSQPNLQLLVNLPATDNVQLQVGQATETVTVSAQAVTLNTTDATLGNAVNNATIQALPMEGRNVPDLLSLQPGVLYLGRQVNTTSDSRTGAVSGTRSDQSNVTLDGVDDNDELYGLAFTGVLRSTLDSVEEFRVTTTDSNADTGRSAGAQVVMMTKSGTNNFHGSAYEYNRNTAFAANDWFNKLSQYKSGLPNKPGELIRNTFGASLGGPIKKNKLFFFANYEGQRTSENQQVTRTVPTGSFTAGTIQYYTTGNTVVSLSPSQIAGMDPQCTSNGTCPWGPGDNPNALTVLKTYPGPNSTATGDGLNTEAFTFSAPDPGHLNTTIAKLDYALSNTNHLFIRGNYQRDVQAGVPEFPGQAPSTAQVTHANGVAVGDTWMISASKVNNFRYGYTMETQANQGLGNNSYVSFGNGVSPPFAETSTSILHVPVNNFVDDFTWVKGSHTIEFGGNYELMGIDTTSNSTSYDSGSMGIGLLYAAAISDLGEEGSPTDLDPTSFGYPVVASSFRTSYDDDIMALTGIISLLNYNNNYQVAKGGQSSTLLPLGSIIPRDFRENEFEWYIQDQWRVTPNFTLTYGVRHSLQQTPYEVHGQQVAPTVNMNQWFLTRKEQAALGNSVQPPFTFAPSGNANGGKPYWPMNTLNFAPRLAIAYSPTGAGPFAKLFGGPGKSAIRAGFGMYYDHYGPAIAASFSQNGSFGLTSTVTTPQNIWTVDDAPRFTCITCIPTNLPTPITPAPSTQQYPVTPPEAIYGSGFEIARGIDDALKTPYSFNVDLSFQRQISGGFTAEFDYVGTFGRNLLQQTDLAQPLDLVDPASKMDYYGAAKLLSQAYDQGETTVAPIAYWEDMFPAAAGMAPDGQVQSATQNIYQYLWKQERAEGNEIGGIGTLDALCMPLFSGGNYPCGGTPGAYSRYWPLQYSSLYSWDTIGVSNYSAFQFVLKHPVSHGLQVDFSYTFGKSLDMGSDATRATLTGGSSHSHIVDAWLPGLNYGPSDFDIRNDVTIDWVYNLPFGHGQAFAGGAHGVLQALIGGWQFSGLNRWTSGLPFSVSCGPGWTTNWDYRSYCVQTAPIETGLYYTSSGIPRVFQSPTTLQNDLTTGTPWRRPYAGEVGSRNNLRGAGVFDIDTALSKSWQVREGQAVEFRWEAFNATNSVRFDVNSLQTVSSSGSLGNYSSTLSTPRVMQFSLRYTF